jgi:hypothetical protein
MERQCSSQRRRLRAQATGLAGCSDLTSERGLGHGDECSLACLMCAAAAAALCAAAAAGAGNQIGDVGAAAFAEGVKVSRTLTELSLASECGRGLGLEIARAVLTRVRARCGGDGCRHRDR